MAETNLKSQQTAVRGDIGGSWRQHSDGQVSGRLKEVMGFQETLVIEKSLSVFVNE